MRRRTYCVGVGRPHHRRVWPIELRFSEKHQTVTQYTHLLLLLLRSNSICPTCCRSVDQVVVVSLSHQIHNNLTMFRCCGWKANLQNSLTLFLDELSHWTSRTRVAWIKFQCQKSISPWDGLSKFWKFALRFIADFRFAVSMGYKKFTTNLTDGVWTFLNRTSC